MEAYGRPHVARRNTSPSVSFLNGAKTREGATTFTPPTSARNQESDAVANVAVTTSGGTNGSSDAATILFHHSRPPPSGRPPFERPQSGGVRRPAPDVTAAPTTAAKQRPNTARESSRTMRQLLQSVPVSSDVETLFTQRQSENTPESDRVDDGGTSTSGGSTFDEAYVRQLKADILYCHELLSCEQTNPLNPALSTSRSHTHVKNVQSMRESRLPQHIRSAGALQSQLARYNASTDPAQLQSAKARLEDLLAQSLTLLMRQFLELHEDKLDDCRIDEDDQQLPDNPIGLLRPKGKHVPFANGCGADSASIYAGCLFGVFRRVEQFRTMIVGLQSEKASLAKDIQEKDRHTQRLSEQLELFKDALAKAVSRRSKNDTQSQPLKRLSVSLAEDNPAIHEDEILDPQVQIERELERSALIQTLEKERVHLEDRVHKMQSELDVLSLQLRQSKAEIDQRTQAALSLQTLLDEAAAKSTRELRFREQQEKQLQSALSAVSNRCHQLEETSDKERRTLRNDKHELEMRIRKLEEEVHAKAHIASQNATSAAEFKRCKERNDTLATQLKSTEAKLMAAMKECDSLRGEWNEQRSIVAQLRQERDSLSRQVEDAAVKLQHSNALHSSQENLLRQTELKLMQAHSDIQRQSAVIEHQANQVGLLETKLSQSVSLDENERKRQQQEEDTAWNQKVTSLEHALAVERQTVQSLKEEHSASIAMEIDKADHTISQAKAVSLELETANLCLAERKRQREKELQEFEGQKIQLLDRISQLMDDLDSAKATAARLHEQQHARVREQTVVLADKTQLEEKIEDLLDQLAKAKANALTVETEASERLQELRAEYEVKLRDCEQSSRQAVHNQIESYRCAAENALAAELEVRQHLEVVVAERDVLLHKLQGEMSSPRGAALSEARVELQKAKLRIAALEEKLNKSDTARGKDWEGKAAVLAAREKKLLEDQKAVKKLKQELSADKKQLRLDRETWDSDRARVEADKLHNRDEHKLLRQIISLLASRLTLQMELLRIIPPEMIAAGAHPPQPSRMAATPSSLTDFINKFRHDHTDEWREMQVKWERLQQELDDADWQLVHMRNRLEELNLSGSVVHQPAVPRPKTPISSPFSDAVAAGKDTVPVVEQLHSSGSTPKIPGTPSHKIEDTSSDQPSSCLRGLHNGRDEEQETFAIALAKEMRAMKESYESKLEDLQLEIRKIQKLRVDSTHRLRSELDDEKKRNQQIIAQLTERCEMLETQLEALRRALTLAQDRQIELLQQYSSATTESARVRILRAIHTAVEEACKEEMARRDAREQDRVRKLLDYCGSSSVAVERDETKRIL